MHDIELLPDGVLASAVFAGIPADQLAKRLGRNLREVVFQTGQELIARGEISPGVFFLVEGSVRLLGGSQDEPVPLELIGKGSSFGWFSRATGVPCEWARASSATKVLELPGEFFDQLLKDYPDCASSLRSKVALSELHPAVVSLLKERGLPVSLAKSVSAYLLPHASVLQTGGDADEDAVTLLSGNGRNLRLPKSLLQSHLDSLGEVPEEASVQKPVLALAGSEGAPREDTDADDSSPRHEHSVFHGAHHPFYKAANPKEAFVACLRMMAGQLELPFRASLVRRSLAFLSEDRSMPSLPKIGSVADMIGIATQPLKLPSSALRDLDAPFLMLIQESPVVVQGIGIHGLLVANPLEKDKKKRQQWVSWKDLPTPDDGNHMVLLARRSRPPKGDTFGFRSFGPYIRKHLRTFVEVVIASLFIQIFALANPLIIQIIIDKVIVQESLGTLDVLGGLLIISTLFSATLTAIRTFLFTDATNRIDLALGMRILEHLYRLPLPYFHKRPVGEIASRLRELDHIRGFLTGTAITALLDAFFAIIYVAIMLYYSMELSAIALIGVPLMAGLTLFVSPIIRQQLKIRSEKGAATEAHLVESISGIQTIKGQNIETRSRWKWYRLYGEMIAANFRNTITSTSAATLGTLISRFNDIAVLWVGVYMVINQKITLGQLIAFRILAGYVSAPLLRLVQSWQHFQEAALSVNRLGDVANRAREDLDSDEQIPMPEISGAVACRNVDFGYAPGKLQLDQVSLDVPAGSLVAMVGLSGSGKSTLLKLIARLYEPVKGRIEIDGMDVCKVELNSLRSQVGMVFQETLLLDGSIFDNIALSDPEASPEAVMEAAKLAEAHQFIMNLSNGYASPVGEQGRNLSGGQRQRIALARLIMQAPNLLILDEATSALDAPTEQRVINNLKQRFSGKTIFFATHRLSTVRMADLVFYLENGVLMESGTHAELMDKKGLYYSLAIQQDAA